MGTIERKAIVAAQQWARKLSIRLRESRGRKEQKRKLQNSRKTIKMAISAYVSVIMLNANSLIKRPISLLPTRDSFQTQGHRVRGKGWEETFHAGGNQEEAGEALLILNKPDFLKKAVIKDK